jgi:ribonuclease HI
VFKHANDGHPGLSTHGLGNNQISPADVPHVASHMSPTLIHTDGGCSGNPGVGGWGFLLRPAAPGAPQEGCGGEPLTTNNRMELTAVIRALERLLGDARLRRVPADLHTDSRYVEQGLNSWLPRWQANGWKTASKAPVKNADLWQRLVELRPQLDVAFKWVRGHAGDPNNERCHELVQQAIAEQTAAAR